MTARRGRARFEPITWHLVSWRRSRHYQVYHDARRWCRENVGVERADWEYQDLHRRWRFRDAEKAFLFQLIWG